MAYESFVEKIKFRSGQFNPELFEKILKYLIDNKLITSESIEAYRSGLEVSIPSMVEMDLVKEFNIDPIQAVDYLNIASHIIAMAIMAKIFDRELTDELEEYIVKKLYTPEIKRKFLIRRFMTNPILEDIDIIEFTKETSHGPLKSYGIRLLIDESGDRDYEEYFFETSEETLKAIAEKITKVISHDEDKKE